MHFYSFSDAAAFYQQDTIISGGLETNDRLVLEATDLPQDQITFESDFNGKLIGFVTSGSDRVPMRDGQILADKKVFKSSQPISGAKFDNDIDEILKSGLNNFQQQYILRSPDIFRDIENFEVHPNNVEFTVGDERPISSSKQQVKSINELPNFLNDKHLSHIPNYRFMPPVNKPRFNFQEGEPLGDYDKIQPDEFKTFDDVKVELDRFDQKGYSELVSFQETTEENNIFSQVFEISGGRVTKLDIIDFGTFPSQENESDKHVFFAGKLFTDDRGVRSFVRIFTIVFE